MAKLIKLNVGCGAKQLKGWVNLDSHRLPGVDVVHDLNKYPWPFKNSSVKCIFAESVLEHLDSKTRPIEEAYRILVDGGELRIIVPFCPSVGAFSDPTHKQFYSYYSFDHYNPANGLHYYVKPKFKTKMTKLHLYRPLFLLEKLLDRSEKLRKIYAHTLAGIFPPTIIEFVLVKCK
jgi:predicted SAM-dependent methyltransferase